LGSNRVDGPAEPVHHRSWRPVRLPGAEGALGACDGERGIIYVYVDGSALSRYLVDLPESLEWRRWAPAHQTVLLTTPLGLTELRLVANPLDFAARALAHEVGQRVAVLRFSDQAMATAVMARAVLSPFNSLHLGTAVSHPDIGAVATYDALLARVATIYGLSVCTPGRPDRWWDF
jgi:predicted nucleic acid-binding protein